MELKPGAITEIVTVTAEAAMLQTDRSDAGSYLQEIARMRADLHRLSARSRKWHAFVHEGRECSSLAASVF